MLRVGVAEIDITPPPNVPMAGYGARKKGSEGIHDPLSARALVVDNGKARWGWVIADLLGLWADAAHRARALAAEKSLVPAECIMISATHNHGGPDTRPRPDTDADHAAHEAYLDALPGKLADCLAAAASNLAEATVSFGRAVTDKVQHNRRYHMLDGKVAMDWENPDAAQIAYRGPIDPAVQVLAFESKGALRALLVQFACHATVMDSGNRLITADWPGAARRHLARLLAGSGTGDPQPWIAIAQGCCGDINPQFPRDDYREAEAKGRLVAEAAQRALEVAEPVRGDEVASAIVPVRLPKKGEGLGAARTGENYEGQVQAFRIGDVAIVGLPGEIFVGVGLAVKAHSPFHATFVGSYANDYEPGYVPVAAEYAGGGYEVETSKVALGADALLADAAREALALLHRGV